MAPWKEIARLEQQHFLQIFGSADWDLYRPEEKKLLSDKVALAIFGPPHTKYMWRQIDRVKEVTDAISREGVHGIPDGIWMSIVIVFVKRPKDDYYCHPVFRVPKYSDGSIKRHAFIDCVGRVYNSWVDFLENNKLPESEICYPVDGVYRGDRYGDVVIDFAHCKSSVLLNVADKASNLLVGVAVAAMVLLPLAAPLVTAAYIGSIVSWIYGVARVIYDQVDRVNHGQSIGLADPDSLWNWYYIVACLVNVGFGMNYRQLNGNLSKTDNLDIMIKVVGAFRPPSAAEQEIFRDIRAKAMLPRDLSAYVFLLSHTIADDLYVANFLNSDDGNNILQIKNESFIKVEHDETVRYIESSGTKSGKLEGILSEGMYSELQSSFSFVDTVHVITNYVLGLVEWCWNKFMLLWSCF